MTFFKGITAQTVHCLLALYLWLTLTDGQCERPQVVCSDIITSERMWGYPCKGIDIAKYTSDQLQWIGNWYDGFYCTQTATSMSFGSSHVTYKVMIALLGPGAYPTTWGGHCSHKTPRRSCNAPDKQVDITKLCQQLGYESGTFVQEPHATPEVHWDSFRATWTSDFVQSTGGAKSITCSNPCPANTPISNPTVSDNVCTFPKCNSNVALDIVFLMDESGSIKIDEWRIMINFVKRLINLDINDISFVSLIEYGSIQTEGTMLDFNQFLDFTELTASNRKSILAALDNNAYTTTGYTYTADAIQRTINIFNDWNKNSDSENIRPDLLFILTDGDSDDTLCPDLQDIAADSGVEIVVIGIGSRLNADSWSDPFYCLADIKRNSFYVEDFEDTDFNHIEGELRDKTCQSTQISNAMRIPFQYDPNVWSTNTVLNTNTIQIDYKIAIGIIILIGFLCCIIIAFILCSIESMQNLKANIYRKTYQNDMEHL